MNAAFDEGLKACVHALFSVLVLLLSVFSIVQFIRNRVLISMMMTIWSHTQTHDKVMDSRVK